MTAPSPPESTGPDADAAPKPRRAGARSTVLIAGAGIGGLAAALAIAQRGIPVHVMERREVFNEEGAGIQIGPNGTRILADLGVADRLRPKVGLPEALSVRDGASGAELTRLPLGDWMRERHGSPYWVAHRKDLHAALLETALATPLITLAMGFDVVAADSNAQRVEVRAKDGATLAGKALVAADGIWSPLRQALFATPPPQFSGKSACRSVVSMRDVPAELRRMETTIWLFAEAHVVHYPVSAGEEMAIVVVRDDAQAGTDWSAPVSNAAVAQGLPTCAPPLAALIAAAPQWRRWALHTLAVPEPLAQGRVALLGDAAHPTLPFLAQGGVMALEDAAVIAAALDRNPGSVVTAFAAYARLRRPRVVRVVEASARNGRIYHLSGVGALARNLALRTAPAEKLIAGYDWLYGWRAD